MIKYQESLVDFFFVDFDNATERSDDKNENRETGGQE